MALKQYKPNTPGQRGLVLVDKSDLFKGKPVKKLTVGLNKSGGRNNSGKITMWQRGGGHKRRYRIIDFKRTKLDLLDQVLITSFLPEFLATSAFFSRYPSTNGPFQIDLDITLTLYFSSSYY